MTAPSSLLSSLKDFSQCNDTLAASIRSLILEPFQPDMSQPEASRQAKKPSRNEFKSLATKLAPLAARVVNQNIESLFRIKEAGVGKERIPNRKAAIDCLVDTAFYATAALKHMKAYTKLKPLDIEKTTSNLICKIVEVGEYGRALEELHKFRANLTKVATALSDSSMSPNISFNSPNTTSANQNDGVSINSFGSTALLTTQQPTESQREKELIQRYGELLSFPLDSSITDVAMILLVLAYQANVIRCWSDIDGGSLLRHLPYYINKPGNFLEWCKHLVKIDASTAKKQLDLLCRLLTRASRKVPLSGNAALHRFHLQSIASKASVLSRTSTLQSLCDNVVRNGIAYEKYEGEDRYENLRILCGDFLDTLASNGHDIPVAREYFVLCDFYAYVARKTNNFSALTLALNHIMSPLRGAIHEPNTCSYFQAAYAAHSRLSLASAQIDRAADVKVVLQEAVDCLKVVSAATEKDDLENENINRIMATLCKSVNSFRQSSANLYDTIEKEREKGTNETMSDDNNYTSPPSCQSYLEKEFGRWKEIIQQITSILDHCQDALSATLRLIKKKLRMDGANHTSLLDNIALAFVDVMILLSRIHFDVELEHTYQEAYGFLSDAENLCRDLEFPSGYRWLSAEYYAIGTSMVSANIFSKAIYALRKGCLLLEKDEGRASTLAGKLHLCKRYETLGICCLKSNEFEDGIKSFRLALKRLPATAIEAFVKNMFSDSISTLRQQNPLIPKLIDRFLRSSIVSPSQDIVFASDIVDTDAMDSTQICIIFECELRTLHVLSAKMDLTTHQSKLINLLLHHYTPNVYPIRRARVLLEKVRVERSKRLPLESAINSALECAVEARKLLTSKIVGEDSGLLHCRKHYLALALSWIAICSHELDKNASDAFGDALELWKSLLDKIKPFYDDTPTKEEIQQVHRNIDDIESFHDHLRMLSDLFDVHHQSTYQVNTLRLMLKLNNGLRESDIDQCSASIEIYARIGKIYSERGYTGKASLDFSRAKSIIQSKPCSVQSELTYLVLRAQDAARAPNSTRSQQILSQGRKLWGLDHVGSEIHPIRSARLRLTRMLTLADAHLARSLIALSNDSLVTAIDDSKTALRVLNRCTTIVRNRVSNRREDTAVQDPFESKPIGAQGDTRHCTENNVNVATDIAFREVQWVISQKISTCLRHLGRLHMIHGTWREAQYCFEQGRLLGNKVRSKIMIYQFLVNISDLQVRNGNLEKCVSSLEEATAMRPKGTEFLYEQATLQSVVGAVKVRQNSFDAAIESFDGVHKLFDMMMDDRFIENIDSIKQSNVKQERNSEPFDTSYYECWPLKEMQGCNDMQKAQAMAQNGSANAGWELLNRVIIAAAANADLAELSAASSHIRHMMACDELSKYAGIGRVPHEALILPLLKFQQRRECHKFEHADTSQALVHMLQRYQQGAMVARVDVLQKLCVEMGFSTFFKHYLANGDNALGPDYVALCAYYLEMSKATNIRREMQFCLEQKLTLPRTQHYIGDDEWPKNLSSKDNDATDIDDTDLFLDDPDIIAPHLQELRAMYRQEHQLDSTGFQEMFVDILPNRWTVCSLTMDPHNRDLYVSRMRASETPFVVKLPLDRVVHRQTTHDVLQYSEAAAELNDIIRSSDETIHGSKKNLEKQEVNEWWMTRMQLDRRLKKLLGRIENDWFSGFRASGLLCGNYHEHEAELTNFQKLISSIITSAVSESVNVSIDICRTMLRLGPEPRSRDVEDVVYFLTSCYKNYNLASRLSATDIEQLNGEICSTIRNYHTRSRRAGIDTMARIPGDHIILILDKHTHMFPLESMPIMRPQAVSRLPCISFLRDRIAYGRASSNRTHDEEWEDIKVDRQSAYYILNPSGDLMNTQREFESTFRSTPGWSGIVQEKPSEMLCQQALMSKELYLYFGHSAGQAFLRGQHVRQVKQCPVALLMGCSSGALDSQGDYDPSGYVMNFLLGGSPCVVANLWDVTDKSIDKVTKKIMSTWGLLDQTNHDQTASLVESVVASRDECNLPYLIGAAPVVYGVPVFLKSL